MTGTVEAAAGQVITDMRHDALQLSFVNSSGDALTEGQEVSLTQDGTVVLRSSGTDKPVGIVVKGANDAERVTVRTSFTAVISAEASTAGKIFPGVYAVPTGSKNADGKPIYREAASGDFAFAQAIIGNDVESPVRLGIFNSPVLVP